MSTPRRRRASCHGICPALPPAQEVGMHLGFSWEQMGRRGVGWQGDGSRTNTHLGVGEQTCAAERREARPAPAPAAPAAPPPNPVHHTRRPRVPPPLAPPQITHTPTCPAPSPPAQHRETAAQDKAKQTQTKHSIVCKETRHTTFPPLVPSLVRQAHAPMVSFIAGAMSSCVERGEKEKRDGGHAPGR